MFERFRKEQNETVAAAAIALRDGKEEKIYTAPTHADALAILEKEYPEWFDDTQYTIVEGFVTNTQRFVTRKEAGAIATRAGQLAHLGSPEAERMQKTLYSQALKKPVD